MSLKVKLLSPLARLPERAYNSAGYDLFSSEDAVLKPREVTIVPLGIATEFPPGYAAFLWDRSKYGSEGIHRFAGVIDADYRGEWKVCLYNATDMPWAIPSGTKIAQVVFQRVQQWEVVQNDLTETERGQKGFGSSG